MALRDRWRAGLALALALWASAGLAQWRELSFVDPALDWRTLETQGFSVHFAAQHRRQAQLAAGVAEALYRRFSATLGWRAESRIHLVLLDSADFANGIASPVPFNYSAIFLSPPDEGDLLQNREWLELVLTHELFHVVHLDKAHDEPYSLRGVFGRLGFLFPNALAPRWINEGLAVYAESDPERGYGRLGQSQFEGMMRAEAARGLRSLQEVNAGGRGFPLNRDYLYGAYFFAFLAERYGPGAAGDFIERYSRNLVPFRVESTATQVTGKPMAALWLEYHDWLRARFAPHGAEAGAVLARAFSISSPTLAPADVRWYIQYDGYIAPKLLRQQGAAPPEVVREVELDARLAAAPDGALVLAEPDICRNYNYFYDLYRPQADGGWRRLSRCGRLRLAAPLEDGRIAALRVEAGRSEAVLLDRNGTLERVLYRAAHGEALSGIAAKGAAVVVASLRAGLWSLLEVGRDPLTVLVSDPAVKHSLRFGDDEELYFVGGYGNAYDVWSLRPGRRNLARWTRAANGVREISAPRGGEMLLTTIEADGDALRLYRLPAHPLERRELPAPVGLASAQTKEESQAEDRPYSPWPSLRPHAWLPLIFIYDGAIELGAAVSGQDALGLHRYYVAPRYELTQNEPLGDAEYVYDGRHGALLSRWLTIRDEEDGDIRVYSTHERAQWVSTWRALSLNRRFYWGLGGALERERLHGESIAASSLQDERVIGLVAGVDTRRERWLSEGPSQGLQLKLFAETSSGLGGAFSGNVYRADWRGHLALGASVLALRWNEAYGQDQAEPFELGGSFSDELFVLPVLNEREFALRGYSAGEPALTGHRARVATIEWRTPLADVDRHYTSPPVGLNRVSLNLFMDVGAAWDRDTRPDYHRGVGAELMTELRFGYLFFLHARAGIAKGIDATGETTGYLRVGRSF
jgi:hypothetical protein